LKTQEGKLNYLNTLARHIGKTDPLTQKSFFEVTAEVSEDIGEKGKKPDLLLESAKAYERLGQKEKVNQAKLKAAELYMQNAEKNRNFGLFDEATELFDQLGEKDKKRDSLFKKATMMVEEARINPHLSGSQKFSDYQETEILREAADLFKSIGAQQEEGNAAILNIQHSLSQRGGERMLTESGKYIISFLQSHGVPDDKIGDVVERGGRNVFDRWDHSPYTGGHAWNPYILQGASRTLRQLGLTDRANKVGKDAARFFLQRGDLANALRDFEEADDKSGVREAAVAMLERFNLHVGGRGREVDLKEFMELYHLKKEDVLRAAGRLMNSAREDKRNSPISSSYARLAETRVKGVLDPEEADQVIGKLYESIGENFVAVKHLSRSPITRPHAIELARRLASQEIKKGGYTGYSNAIYALEHAGLDRDGTPEDIELLATAYEKLGTKDGPKKAIALRRRISK